MLSMHFPSNIVRKYLAAWDFGSAVLQLWRFGAVFMSTLPYHLWDEVVTITETGNKILRRKRQENRLRASYMSP